MKRILTILLALAMLTGGAALAQQARDITTECEYHASASHVNLTRDGSYGTRWMTEHRNAYIEILTPQDAPAQYLYICFGGMPEDWEIQAERNGEWTTVCKGEQGMAHVLTDVGAQTHFRFYAPNGEWAKIEISELHVFTAGELPEWVQRWEPPCRTADLLVLAAHPDDELLFLGGTIPTYAGQRGLDVCVAYMTCGSWTRRSEALDGLWHMGVRQYPVFGSFDDKYFSTRSEAYEYWGKDRAERFVTELLRRFKPDVVVTHDVNGEYGHGAHRVCADMMRECVPQAGDAEFEPEIAAQYGVWTVKKLYLHLYGENRVTMNWREPLTAFGGRTALEMTQEAFALHVSQQNKGHRVKDEGELSCAEYGLCLTTVGPDVLKNDFFENIDAGSGN